MKIETVFDEFITALEENRTEALDKLLTEDIIVDSSALGILRGRDACREAFCWQGRPVDFVKIRVFNNILRQCGKEASQSAFFVLMVGKMENGFMNLFQCAFLNALKYIQTAEGWKICDLRSNMTFECGNTMFVSNWWKLIDYSTFNGCDREILSCDMAPWVRIPQTDIPLAEEEKIRQTAFGYCWRIDTSSFDRLREIATEEMHFAFPGMDPREAGGYPEWVSYLEGKRFDSIVHNGQTMPRNVCWNHIFLIDRIEVSAELARVYLVRYEPNRIGNYMQHRYNLNTLFISTPMVMNMRRDSRGNWKLFKTEVISSALTPREIPFEQRYF